MRLEWLFATSSASSQSSVSGDNSIVIGATSEIVIPLQDFSGIFAGALRLRVC